jgi:hypothetical protein
VHRQPELKSGGRREGEGQGGSRCCSGRLERASDCQHALVVGPSRSKRSVEKHQLAQVGQLLQRCRLATLTAVVLTSITPPQISQARRLRWKPSSRLVSRRISWCRPRAKGSTASSQQRHGCCSVKACAGREAMATQTVAGGSVA